MLLVPGINGTEQKFNVCLIRGFATVRVPGSRIPALQPALFTTISAPTGPTRQFVFGSWATAG